MKTPTKKQLLTLNIISGLLLIPFPLFFIGSTFLFSTAGSEESIVVNIMYYSILTYPISFLLSMIGTWLGYKKGKNIVALYMALLPVLNVLAFIIGMAVVILACDGSLVCY